MSDERDAGSDPQPLPTVGDGRDVMAELVKHVEARRAFGKRKYGQTMSPFNGRDMLKDAIDEVIDLAAYLVGESMERDAPPATADSELGQLKIKYRLLLDHAVGLRQTVKDLYDVSSFDPKIAPAEMVYRFPKLVQNETHKALIESVSVSRIQYAFDLEEGRENGNG